MNLILPQQVRGMTERIIRCYSHQLCCHYVLYNKEASAPQDSTSAVPRTIRPAYVFTFTLLVQKAAQDRIKQPNQEKEHTRWQQLLKQEQPLWSSVSENTCRTGRM